MPSPLPRWNCWLRPSLTSPTMTAFPVLTPGRLPHYRFRGLLSVHSHYGLHARRVPFQNPLHHRLQPLRYLHVCSGCYRSERKLPGRIRTCWKKQRLCTAHVNFRLSLTPLQGRVEMWRGGLGKAYLFPTLSFVGASISQPCSVSTSRSSNRTGGFPASGSRTRLHAFAHGRLRVLCGK